MQGYLVLGAVSGVHSKHKKTKIYPAENKPTHAQPQQQTPPKRTNAASADMPLARAHPLRPVPYLWPQATYRALTVQNKKRQRRQTSESRQQTD